MSAERIPGGALVVFSGLLITFLADCTSVSGMNQGPASPSESTQPAIDLGVGELSASASVSVEAPVNAYLSAYSVSQGETIYLYANTSLPDFNMRIYSIRPDSAVVRAAYTDISGVEQIIQDEAWSACCDWVDPVAITIPDNWESGLYRIQLSVDKSYPYRSDMMLSFIVKEDVPGSESQIVVLDNAPNEIAYNRWGGASSYWHEMPEMERARTLSISRPGNNIFQWVEESFMNWIQYMGITVEYASLMDLEADPSFLFAYQTVILVGHSEYWSRNQREALDSFIAGGGNVIVLGGNNMWWQVRFEGDQMRIYKDPYLDPLLGVNDDLVTSLWYDWPINDPENRTIGLSFRYGGMVNNQQGYMPLIEGNGGLTVARANHRYLAGTGLANGSQFGRLHAIVGYEVDGAEFNWVDGYAIPTHADGTPDTFEIIATAPADTGVWQGFATMGVFDTGYGTGRLFNAATINWANGLFDGKSHGVANPYVSKIMLNVLAEFQPNSEASCVNSAMGSDYDGDGVDDTCDNCIAIANSDQFDTDLNGTGDMCESKVAVRIAMDIKPWDDSNKIDINQEAFISVALLSESRGSEGPLDFNAADIDASSLRFGPGSTTVVKGPFLANFGGDAAPDMGVAFSVEGADFLCDTEQTAPAEQLVLLEGRTVFGQAFEAMQKVEVECEEFTGCHP